MIRTGRGIEAKADTGILLEVAVGNSNWNFFEQSEVPQIEDTKDVAPEKETAVSAEVSAAPGTTYIPQVAYTTPGAYSDIPQVYITALDKEIKKTKYVEASVKIVDPLGQYDEYYDEASKVKIRGNSTADLDKKPYEYTPQFRFVDVWVNGRYMGDYLLTTPIEVGENRLNLSLSDGDALLEIENEREEEGVVYIRPNDTVRIAINEPEKPSDADVSGINFTIEDFENSISEGDFGAVKSKIDLDSFVDFYIVNELFKNADFFYSSTRYYIKNHKIYAGPVWDFDMSSGNCREDYYREGINAYDELFVFSANWPGDLYKFEEFRTLVKARYIELQPVIENLYADNGLGRSVIDSFTDAHLGALLRDSSVAGWGFNSFGNDRHPDQTYQENVEYFRSWLRARNEYLLQILGSEGEF